MFALRHVRTNIVQPTRLGVFYAFVLGTTATPIVRFVTKPDPTGCLDEYNITPYATNPFHEQAIWNCLEEMPWMTTVPEIDTYIRSVSCQSPVTGQMVWKSSKGDESKVRLMLAIMRQDSGFGTTGLGARTHNPGNVGNTDNGSTRDFKTWAKGVQGLADWLDRNQGNTDLPWYHIFW